MKVVKLNSEKQAHNLWVDLDLDMSIYTKNTTGDGDCARDRYGVEPQFTGKIEIDDGRWAFYKEGKLHCDLGPANSYEAFYLEGKCLIEKEEYWKKVWKIHKDNPEKARIIAAHLLAKKIITNPNRS